MKLPGRGSRNSNGYSSGGRRQDMRDAADLYKENPITLPYDKQKADLEQAKFLSFISGLPIIGDLYRGEQQARYMDDYYSNTGMVPKYPGLNMPGYSGLGRVAGNLALTALSGGRTGGYNVKEGTNDLLTFYNYAYA